MSIDTIHHCAARGIKYLSFITWIALIAIIAMVVTDVSGRFLLGRPLPASLEIAQLLMPFVVFPALAHALAMGRHVRVSLVTMRLPPRMRLSCDIFAHALGLGFFLLLTYFSWRYSWNSYVIREFVEARIHLPWWPSKLIYAVGITALCAQFLISLVVILRRGTESEENVSSGI